MKNNHWNISTLEKEGMNEKKVEEFIDNVEIENIPIHSLVIIKGGNIVKDISFNYM